ncbi:MAG: hypothetical protein AAF217_03485 [Pseudomonadota bacterium]
MQKHIVTFLCLLVVVLAALPAYSQARPDVRKMTCSQAQSLIKKQGAIVVTTGQYTYERVVSTRRFCQMTETTRQFFTETKNNQRCNIGRLCVERIFSER